jgi:hypothetical protein
MNFFEADTPTAQQNAPGRRVDQRLRAPQKEVSMIRILPAARTALTISDSRQAQRNCLSHVPGQPVHNFLRLFTAV